jgi:hypothetical protein
VNDVRLLNKKGTVVKRIALLVAAAAAAALISCSETTTGTDGEIEKETEYGGIFLIISELVSNDCAIPVPPTEFVTISVEDDTIYFGSFAGDWDENTLNGAGTTPETTIPVDPPDCYAYFTVSFDITYVDADSFSGTYGSSYRKDPECPNPDPCSFLYNITGSRQQ